MADTSDPIRLAGVVQAVSDPPAGSAVVSIVGANKWEGDNADEVRIEGTIAPTRAGARVEQWDRGSPGGSDPRDADPRTLARNTIRHDMPTLAALVVAGGLATMLASQ